MGHIYIYIYIHVCISLQSALRHETKVLADEVTGDVPNSSLKSLPATQSPEDLEITPESQQARNFNAESR